MYSAQYVMLFLNSEIQGVGVGGWVGGGGWGEEGGECMCVWGWGWGGGEESNFLCLKLVNWWLQYSRRGVGGVIQRGVVGVISPPPPIRGRRDGGGGGGGILPRVLACKLVTAASEKDVMGRGWDRGGVEGGGGDLVLPCLLASKLIAAAFEKDVRGWWGGGVIPPPPPHP